MNNENENIFQPSGCLTPAGLFRYAGQQLSEKSTAEVERHLEGCQLCTDALEGYQGLPPDDFEAAVEDLRMKLREQTSPKATNVIRGTIYRVAAVLLLFSFISSMILLYLRNSETANEIAQSNQEVEERLADVLNTIQEDAKAKTDSITFSGELMASGGYRIDNYADTSMTFGSLNSTVLADEDAMAATGISNGS